MRFKVKFNELYNVSGVGETYILVDENGRELVGVVVDNKQVFNATANDIREGMVAATEKGVTVGTKQIPSYHTLEGIKVVPNGSSFSVKLRDYDYTKLQAIICTFNKSLSNSVFAEKIGINDNVYNVRSTEVLATITKDHENGMINFGIVNTLGVPCLIRYFTYKEIY